MRAICFFVFFLRKWEFKLLKAEKRDIEVDNKAATNDRHMQKQFALGQKKKKKRLYRIYRIQCNLKKTRLIQWPIKRDGGSLSIFEGPS